MASDKLGWQRFPICVFLITVLIEFLSVGHMRSSLLLELDGAEREPLLAALCEDLAELCADQVLI